MGNNSQPGQGGGFGNGARGQGGGFGNWGQGGGFGTGVGQPGQGSGFGFSGLTPNGMILRCVEIPAPMAFSPTSATSGTEMSTAFQPTTAPTQSLTGTPALIFRGRLIQSDLAEDALENEFSQENQRRDFVHNDEKAHIQDAYSFN